MPNPKKLSFVANYIVACLFLSLGWVLIKKFENQLGIYSGYYSIKKAEINTTRSSKLSIGPVYEDKGSYDYLLIESILTIVKNYYVDEERTNNQYLLLATLKRLQEHGDLSFKTSDQKLIIERNNRIVTLEGYEDIDLNTLVSHCNQIAELLRDPDLNASSQDSQNWLHEGRFKFLDSMLGSLDPHSSLLDHYAYKELRQGTEGSFGGLGVVVGVKKDLLTVIKPIPRSPASRAGIIRNDQIIKINETSTFGVTLDNLVDHMRGAPGTAVNLSIMRQNSYSPLELSIKREVIQVDSVYPTLINQNNSQFLHLLIEGFSARTSSEVKSHIEFHSQAKPLDGVIIDLRGNPGGLLDQAVAVSDLFLGQGTIVSTNGRRTESELATESKGDFDVPLVVIINGDSASASEIVAGALKDNKRAVILGQPSFGKGSVQTIFELPGDQALKLTIARYYSPNGTSIQNKGIKPDIWVHPVVKQDKNINLLGAYRYRNEKFLKNSLDDNVSQGSPLTSDGVTHQSYYLIDSTQDSPQEEDLQNDYEVQLALLCLDGIKSDLPTHSNDRAKFLTPSKCVSMIDAVTSAKESVVQNWIKDKFQIDWSDEWTKDDYSSTIANSVKLSQEVPSRLVIGHDAAINLKWTYKNSSPNPITRASIFVQVGIDNPLSFEFLVGKIAAHSSGTIEGQIPMAIANRQKKIPIRFGFSHNGEPEIFYSDPKFVKVIDGPTPELTASVELVGDTSGSKPGVLEANEVGILKVKLENRGTKDAHDLNIEIVNLAGMQVSLSETAASSRTLAPGASMDFMFPFKANSDIRSHTLGFGVSVSGSNLVSELKRRFEIKGDVTRSSEVIHTLIGH